MKNIVFMNGSPKVNEEAVSKYIVQAMGNLFDSDTANKTFINVRESIMNHKTHEDFETLSHADAIIIAFPLYIFCLPGVLMRFLEDYDHFFIENKIGSRNAKVYCIVNCGFPEPDINLEAVRVIRSFSGHIHAKFRFGVLIGGGGMLLGAKDAPFMKKTMRSINDAFSSIVKDIQSEDSDRTSNFSIAMNVSKRFYFFMGNKGWVWSARKNGLKKADLYRKTYR
jgi:hypothetical protein